jgi:carotenoid cleavage dioxygenase
MTAFGSYFVLQSEHPLYQNIEEAQHMWKFKLNMTTGGYTIEKILPDQIFDFLMINPHYLGKDYQYLYMTIPSMELSDLAKESYSDGGFVKYDVKEDRIISQVVYENEGQGGEVQFVPRVNSTAEDDGYLMTFVYDPTSDSTDFQMWDAQTLEPVLKVGTKQRVPHGMHGTWVNSEDLGDDQTVY